MQSPVKTPLSFIEPHHRPLVWAGGAAFFSFPILSQAMHEASLAASAVWLLPAALLVGLAVTISCRRGGAPIAIVAFAFAAGWFLSGTAGLRLHHQAALTVPRINTTVTDGGVISGVAGADSRRGEGSELLLPLRLHRFSSAAGEEVAASGELELRLRGGREIPRGSEIALPLSAEEAARVASGGKAVTVDGGSVTVSSPTAPGARFRGTLRGELKDAFRRLGEPAAGLAGGLLLGERAGVSPGLLELMRRAGAMHLLALSGMHLAILAGLLGALLYPLLGRLGAVAAALLLFFYFWIVGPIPSLFRALLMFSLGALLKLRGRRLDPRSLLSAALLIALLLSPGLATSLGWRLSTLALVGILWFGLPLWARGPSLWPRKFWSLIYVSFGAFLLTTPLSLGVFGAAYPASILSSLLLTPLVLLFIWFALLSVVLLGIAPFLTLPLGSVGERLYHLLEVGAQAAARIPPLRDGELFWPLLFGGSCLLLLSPWLRLFLRFSVRRPPWRAFRG